MATFQNKQQQLFAVWMFLDFMQPVISALRCTMTDLILIRSNLKFNCSKKLSGCTYCVKRAFDSDSNSYISEFACKSYNLYANVPD